MMEFPVIGLPSETGTPSAPGLDASLDSDAGGGGIAAFLMPGARDDNVAGGTAATTAAAAHHESTRQQSSSVSFNFLGLPAGAMLASSGSHRRPGATAAPFIAGSPDDASFSRSVLCNGLTPIVDGLLYLGSYRDVCDPTACREHGIGAYVCAAADIQEPLPRHVVLATNGDRDVDVDFTLDAAQEGKAEAAEEVGAEGKAPHVPFLHLPLDDSPDQPLHDPIRAACAFIDDQAAHGRRVALYCRAGRSRSVSLAVAYMVHRARGGVTAEEAIDQLRSVYPRADPNIGFLSQLCNQP